jgi:D-3-phosphoglycerate dehydrogenase
MTYKVLITDGLAKEGITILESAGLIVDNKKLNAKELLEQIPPFDALIVRSRTKVTDDVINAAENLKVIGRAGVGLDNIYGYETACYKGIVIKYAPYGNTDSTAELTIGFLHSLARGISQLDHAMKNGKWEKGGEGLELKGKTLGIIGCGRIGKAVAERAKGIKMNVLGYDVLKDNNSGIKYVSLDELLSSSDFVTIHTPKLDKPLGREELEKMKRDKPEKRAYLINASRGDNVDEDALYDALLNDWIAGVALDVYKKEPTEGNVFESRLIELAKAGKKIVMTPHAGASTREAQRKTGIEIADVVLGYLRDADWTNAVNVSERVSLPTYNLFVTHEDKPHVFGPVSDTLGKYGINISELPSRAIGKGKAITIFRLYQPVTIEILDKIRTLPDIHRVAY